MLKTLVLSVVYILHNDDRCVVCTYVAGAPNCPRVIGRVYTVYVNILVLA